jgi:hypothetical protein
MLLLVVACLSIFFSGLFDVAKPQIEKIKENSLTVISGINEIKDELNRLWISDLLPLPSGEMDLDDFSRLTDRKFTLSYFKGLEDVTFDFQDMENGKNVLIECTVKEYVRVDPVSISVELPGAVVEDKVVSLVIRYRKGDLR